MRKNSGFQGRKRPEIHRHFLNAVDFRLFLRKEEKMGKDRISIEPRTAKWRILYALVMAEGEMAFDTLQLMPNADRTVRSAVEELTEAGLIAVRKTDAGKIVRLKQFAKNRDRFMDRMWEGAGGYPLTVLYHTDAEHIRRKHSMAELCMLFSGTGIRSDPKVLDDIADRIEETGSFLGEGDPLLPVFLPSTTCKRLTGAVPEPGNISDRTAAGRFNGCIVSSAGCYTVYSLKGDPAEWGTSEERSSADISRRVRESILGTWPEKLAGRAEEMSYGDTQNRFIGNGAILYMKNYEDFTYCFERPAAGRRNRRTGLECFCGRNTVSHVFDRVYALPAERCAAGLTELMTEPGWHLRLTDLFVEKRFTDLSRSFFDIDGITAGKKILCFVDCDIRRLLMLIMDMAARKNQEEYIIVHYGFQKPFLERLFEMFGIPEGCSFVSCTPEEVLGEIGKRRTRKLAEHGKE